MKYLANNPVEKAIISRAWVDRTAEKWSNENGQIVIMIWMLLICGIQYVIGKFKVWACNC